MALPRKPMLQYLEEKGYLKSEQREEALKVQTQTNETDIGKVLVQLGMVGEREVLQAKAQERGVGFVDLDRITIESNAINAVPERIVKSHNVIPVKKDPDVLYLAMTNPDNIQASDDVRMASGMRVVPVLAVPGAIEDAIRKYYATTEVAKTPTNGATTPAAQTNFNADV